MSADNWGICPRCNKEHNEKIGQIQLRAGEQYGKVSSEKYLKLLECANPLPKIDPTLREDYEIFTDVEGLFFVSYSCSCNKCNFEHHFEHVKILNA